MLRTLVSGLILAATAVPASAADLLMFDSDICPFCEKWHEELGAVYPKTPEGKRAPLRVVDNDLKWPDDIGNVRPVRYTPTFVLVEGGEEVGRITGYNREDFFWGLLGKMIADLPEGAE